MAKRKHSVDWMLARVKEYLSGKGSYLQIARANGISTSSLRGWVRKYEEQGEASFMERAENASYSKESKVSCVLAVCVARAALTTSMLILKHQHGIYGYHFLDICHVYLDRG